MERGPATSSAVRKRQIRAEQNRVTNHPACGARRMLGRTIVLFIAVSVGLAAVAVSESSPSNTLESLFRRVSVIRLQEDADHVIGNPSDIQVDSRGRIAVADFLALKVYVFDGTGKRLLAIGKKGKGPGEFQSVWSVQFGPDGEFVVCDIVLRRVSIFDTDGRLLTSFLTAPDDVVPKRAFLLPDGRVLVVGDTWQTTAEGKPRVTYLHLYDEQFRLVRSWCTASPLLHQRNVYSERGVSVFCLPNEGLVYCAEHIGYWAYLFDFDGKLLDEIRVKPPFYREPVEFKPRGSGDDEFRKWLSKWTLLYRIALLGRDELIMAYRLRGSEEDYGLVVVDLPTKKITTTIRTQRRFSCVGEDGYVYFLESMPPDPWAIGKYEVLRSNELGSERKTKPGR